VDPSLAASAGEDAEPSGGGAGVIGVSARGSGEAGEGAFAVSSAQESAMQSPKTTAKKKRPLMMQRYHASRIDEE
jgi:hypothetical protein